MDAWRKKKDRKIDYSPPSLLAEEPADSLPLSLSGVLFEFLANQSGQAERKERRNVQKPRHKHPEERPVFTRDRHPWSFGGCMLREERTKERHEDVRSDGDGASSSEKRRREFSVVEPKQRNGGAETEN